MRMETEPALACFVQAVSTPEKLDASKQSHATWKLQLREPTALIADTAMHMMHSVTPYIRNIYQGVPYFAKITRYHTGSSIYPRKKSTAIPVLIITRVTMAQQHCVQVSYVKFQLNRRTDVASAIRNVFTPLNKVKTAPPSKTQISEKQPTSLFWR
jgi:predicted NAD/FAD-binding protein